MAEVVLDELGEDQRALVENLAQFYLYDFSEFDPADVGRNGRFDGWLDWRNLFANGRRVFGISVDGQIAGFAIVFEDSEALRDADERVQWLEEFFVMRRYRRQGVGRAAATALFARFEGTWEVGEIGTNTVGQAFWRDVIGLYTGGHFEEVHFNDERWDGPVQYFATT
ncbi:MAG: GNAT family N-acetyltransferase [Actinomycetota bacterium]